MSFNNYAMTVIAIYNRFDNPTFIKKAKRSREYMESDAMYVAMKTPTMERSEDCLKHDVARKMLVENTLKIGMMLSNYDKEYRNMILNSIEIENTIEMETRYSDEPTTKTIIYSNSTACLLTALPGMREVKEADGMTKKEYYIHGLRYETPEVRSLVEIARFFSRHAQKGEVNEMVLDALCKLLTGDTIEERVKRVRSKNEYDQKQERIEERADEVWNEYQKEVNERKSLSARTEATIQAKFARLRYN